MYCVYCGSQAPGNGGFCLKCGKQLVDPAALVAQTDASQPGADNGVALPLPLTSSTDLGPATAQLGVAQSDARVLDRRPAFRKLAIVAGALYVSLGVITLVLHARATDEKRISDEVANAQTQVEDLIFKREERSPQMLELLRWPDGAPDKSVAGYLKRCQDIEPMLTAELGKGRQAHDTVGALLQEVPANNPNHSRLVLLEQLSSRDVHLYETFLLEVELAKRAVTVSPEVQDSYINSALDGIHVQENDALKERQKTIDQLNQEK